MRSPSRSRSFAPIDQVGCSSACFTVAVSRLSATRCGRAARRRLQRVIAMTSRGGRRRGACSSALCSESNRAQTTPSRAPAPLKAAPASDEISLLASARAPGLHTAARRREATAPEIRGEDGRFGVPLRHDLDHRRTAPRRRRAGAGERLAQGRARALVGDGGEAGRRARWRDPPSARRRVIRPPAPRRGSVGMRGRTTSTVERADRRPSPRGMLTCAPRRGAARKCTQA